MVGIEYEQNLRIITSSNFGFKIAKKKRKIQTNGCRKLNLVLNK